MTRREFKRRVHRAAEMVLNRKRRTTSISAIVLCELDWGNYINFYGNWVWNSTGKITRNHRALLLAWYAEVGPELPTEEG